ncbi:succinylglutamate desuccinylase [Hydrogenophaga sp. Root209]|uniref:succinylglutamate desuccinylase/aspartoacylase domain-containing protein n=1 Tax=unclassified Hydrogenophaga TaxID=2610897 RepID=UPI0007014A23|nr:succinylglutamate desuccinylase/aspartoacylase family protein [Hydrogenophaga sp. Root209]KRC10095.1 succinylglutamate desuccinylase [Hydrogenophaga sp. Root209]
MSHTVFSLTKPELGPWRTGNTGTEGVWCFDSGIDGPHVMVSGLVHGNELCGAWALKELLEAGVRPEHGVLTLAFCNLEAFDRFDANDHDASRFVDEDMNRQWMPDRIELGNTRERRRVAALKPFVERADWLLDLHSMHEPGLPLSLAGMHERNLKLARQMRSPEYVVVDAGHEDGVRMRDFGRFGLADFHQPRAHSLLVECGFHGDWVSLEVARDQCFRFLVQAGSLSEPSAHRWMPGWKQSDAPQQWALHVTSPVVARSEHFSFAQLFEGLELVPLAGTVIGFNDGEPVTTPYDNCVLVMPSTRQARSGVTVVRFARREKLD